MTWLVNGSRCWNKPNLVLPPTGPWASRYQKIPSIWLLTHGWLMQRRRVIHIMKEVSSTILFLFQSFQTGCIWSGISSCFNGFEAMRWLLCTQVVTCSYLEFFTAVLWFLIVLNLVGWYSTFDIFPFLFHIRTRGPWIEGALCRVTSRAMLFEDNWVLKRYG